MVWAHFGHICVLYVQNVTIHTSLTSPEKSLCLIAHRVIIPILIEYVMYFSSCNPCILRKYYTLKHIRQSWLTGIFRSPSICRHESFIKRCFAAALNAHWAPLVRLCPDSAFGGPKGCFSFVTFDPVVHDPCLGGNSKKRTP